MDLLFAWDDWNLEHIAKHAVTAREAEFVVKHQRAPWPQQKGDDKLVAWGPTEAGRLLQVIFTLKRSDEIEFDALTVEQWSDLREDDEIVYVIHAMELTRAMKQQYRKRRR